MIGFIAYASIKEVCGERHVILCWKHRLCNNIANTLTIACFVFDIILAMCYDGHDKRLLMYILTGISEMARETIHQE